MSDYARGRIAALQELADYFRNYGTHHSMDDVVRILTDRVATEKAALLEPSDVVLLPAEADWASLGVQVLDSADTVRVRAILPTGWTLSSVVGHERWQQLTDERGLVRAKAFYRPGGDTWTAAASAWISDVGQEIAYRHLINYNHSLPEEWPLLSTAEREKVAETVLRFLYSEAETDEDSVCAYAFLAELSKAGYEE